MKEWISLAFIAVMLLVFVPNACDWDKIKPSEAEMESNRRSRSLVSFMDIVHASSEPGDPEFLRPPREEDTEQPRRERAAEATTTSEPTGTDALIREISIQYDVPAGALYGIWHKESGGLRSGWGRSPHWHRASDLARRGSICVERYDLSRCRRHWEALRRICSQRRRDGTRVCDPSRVRTSYAMAMGPMQHMPAYVLRVNADGSSSWSSRAVDHDGDGVVDPHDLDDAMAMSAVLLRGNYEQKVGELGESAAWRWAVNAYYGSQSAGYYEGSGGRAGVADHWRSWCERYGDCLRSRTAFALVQR